MKYVNEPDDAARRSIIPNNASNLRDAIERTSLIRELEKDVYERQVCYKFDKHISRFKGEVTSTQHKSPLADKTGWLIDEVLTLHGIPLGDYFNLHLRYQIDDRSKGCYMKVSFGVSWLRTTKHQKRISKNIISNLADRLKVMFATIEKEYLNAR